VSKKDDKLKVTDGAYNLPFVEVICVACQTAWGDERIKKIVDVLAAEGIMISIAADVWYSYSYV
jgi:hypothetical protein